jgi:hypothetical protein
MRDREIALHVSDPAFLRREGGFLRSHLLADLAPSARPGLEMETVAWAAVAGLGPAVFSRPVERLYLGNELCPHLDWSDEEILSACELAADSGLLFSLVFGVIRERGFSGRLSLLHQVIGRFGAVEVVASDWGVLSVLKEIGALPVAGRLLFRAKRLPRLSRSVLPDSLDPGVAASEVSKEQLTELAECPWDIPWEREAAARMGVRRADVEMVPQGLRTGTDGLPLSLYLPFTTVTGGGNCPVSVLSVRDGRTVCSRRCRSSIVLPRFPVRTWSLVQVGQTVFMPTHSLMGHYLANERIDRLVVEPGLPM